MARATRLTLLAKSREAALTAVQTYNNPLVKFKSETFIVLMIVAWTYLMHAHYRQHGVELRHLNKDKQHPRRKFERGPDGQGFKWWELSTCIKSDKCPLDKHTVLNLELLIGLRNRIEHHMPPALDEHMSAKYLACTLNYEFWLVTLFGAKHSLDATMAFALHFRELRPAEEATAPKLPAGISSFLTKFEGDLTEEEYQHPRYAYRMIFEKRSVNHRGQADRIVEFLSPADQARAACRRPQSSCVRRSGQSTSARTSWRR